MLQAWFTTNNATEAIFNDILFLRKLETYKSCNKKIVDVTLKKKNFICGILIQNMLYFRYLMIVKIII